MKTLPKTDIPWADRQWPILRGCSAVSEGCANCYARTWHNRFATYMGLPPWGRPHFLRDNLEMPAHTKKPSRVFVAPMSDLGHGLIGVAWLREIEDAMKAAPWHTYIVLTKRPGVWIKPFAEAGAWIGVSCEREARVCERWSVLSQVCAAVRFVSVEPMLEPVSFEGWKVKPDWVIAGPETGTGARPCDDACIDALAAESPCFFDKRDKWTRREFPK